VPLGARRAMKPRADIDGFAPGPLVTRTGPRFRASRPMAEPVVRCMPGRRGAARRRDPAAALYGHGAKQAGFPSPPNGGFWSGRSVASAGVMPLACPHLGGGIPPAGRSAPSAALSSRRGLAAPAVLGRLAETTDWPEAWSVRQPPPCAAPAPSPPHAGSKLLCTSRAGASARTLVSSQCVAEGALTERSPSAARPFPRRVGPGRLSHPGSIVSHQAVMGLFLFSCTRAGGLRESGSPSVVRIPR